MYCPKCKKEFPGKFCTDCGTPLIEKPEQEEINNKKDAIRIASPSDKREAVKIKVEESSKRKAAEEALKAAEEVKRKAEEVLKDAEDVKRKAEEEAKRKAEEAAKRKAEETAKRRAKEEAQKAAEEAKKQKNKFILSYIIGFIILTVFILHIHPYIYIPILFIYSIFSIYLYNRFKYKHIATEQDKLITKEETNKQKIKSILKYIIIFIITAAILYIILPFLLILIF